MNENENENSAVGFVCLKQVALQLNPVQQRRPRSPKGVRSERKKYQNENGSKVAAPCLFLLNSKRQTLKNKFTHAYLSTQVEELLDKHAKTLDLSGCVIDTKNKLLSVVLGRPQFAALVTDTFERMLKYRGVNPMPTAD